LELLWRLVSLLVVWGSVVDLANEPGLLFAFVVEWCIFARACAFTWAARVAVLAPDFCERRFDACN